MQPPGDGGKGTQDVTGLVRANKKKKMRKLKNFSSPRVSALDSNVCGTQEVELGSMNKYLIFQNRLRAPH